MRKAIISGLLTFLITGTLVFSGLGVLTWQYWVIFVSVLAVIVNCLYD